MFFIHLMDVVGPVCFSLFIKIRLVAFILPLGGINDYKKLSLPLCAFITVFQVISY